MNDLFCCYNHTKGLLRRLIHKIVTLLNRYLTEKKRIATIADVELLLVAADFEFSGAWLFWYGGRIIAAEIEDAGFMDAVCDGRLTFRSKNVLTVDMRVKQTLDPRSGQWEDKGFAIIKVKVLDSLRDL